MVSVLWVVPFPCRCRPRHSSILVDMVVVGTLFLLLLLLRFGKEATSFSWTPGAGSVRRSVTGVAHFGNHRHSTTATTRRKSSVRRWMSITIGGGTSPSSALSSVLLNVALDQPLFPSPLPPVFREKGLAPLLRGWWMGLLGSVKLLRCKSISSPIQLVKWTLVFAVLLLFSRWIAASSVVGGPVKVVLRPFEGIWNTIRQLFGATNQRAVSWETTVVPMPFEPSINDGWSVCKLRSIRPYGKTSFLRVDFTLPKEDYVLPLALGQTLYVCGLDKNSQAVQAEFYTFHPNRPMKPGRFSLLVPNPSKGYLPTYGATANDDDNGLQQLRVVQMLQDYVLTGDKDIAIQPGTCQLEYRGAYYPVTEIIYLVMGTGIAPVLDQIRVVLSPAYASSLSSNSGINDISVIWINASLEDFDVTFRLLKKEYQKHLSKLKVVCGIEANLKSISKKESAIYFIENNAEIKDNIPTFQPGMMLVVAIEGLRSSFQLKQAAIEFALQKKEFPLECICAL